MMLFGVFRLWCCDILLVFIYPHLHDAVPTWSNGLHRRVTGDQAAHAQPVRTRRESFDRRNAEARGVQRRRVRLALCSVLHAERSFWTTMEIMAADIVMMGLALREIELERAPAQEDTWVGPTGSNLARNNHQEARYFG
jgi:hypothetical protein